MDIFCQILKTSSTQSSHIQAQECVLAILQSFCDSEISLLQNSIDRVLPINSDTYLANALPTKHHLRMFISAMIDHLMTEECGCFATYLQVLRVLLLLTEHDYGFYLLKEHLCKTSQPFSNLLIKLKKNFSKDDDDCLSTLNIFVQFLKVCSTTEDADAGQIVKPRTMKMGNADIKNLIKWKEDSEDIKEFHPIAALNLHVKVTYYYNFVYKSRLNLDFLCMLYIKHKFQEVLKEDASFENLSTTIRNFISFLQGNEILDSKENYMEPILPNPESLLCQFTHRQVFTVTEAIDERLTSAYWLSTPSEYVEPDIENVCICKY